MKKSIFISALGHLTVISAVLLLTAPVSKSKVYPTIYQVSLVTLPKIQAQVSQPQAETPSGVTFKPEKLTLPKPLVKKKVSQKVQEKPDHSKSQSAQEKPAQQIEGLGRATFEGASLESPYYAGIIFAKIKSMWDNPVQSTTLQVTISFKIQKDGQVTGALVEVSSGNALYDQAALRAVLASNPLPPLPEHYAGNDLTVHLNFVGVP